MRCKTLGFSPDRIRLIMSRRKVMPKKVLCLFSVVLILLSIGALEDAHGQTVFGPKELAIGWLRLHFSRHHFDVDDPGEGILTITKGRADKEIHRGFVLFNRGFIPLRHFLRGDDLVFETTVKLRSHNHLMVFLSGTPGSSITIEVMGSEGPVSPPEATFSAEPETIILGGSTTLIWSTEDAESCTIDHGVGSVNLSGSRIVAPTDTTTYTLTAAGPGGTTTATATVTVTYPAPTVTISAEPRTIQAGETSMLSWRSTYADSALIDGIGDVPVDGSTQVSPSETTPYTITATGPGGTAADTVTVTVLHPPAVRISASPETILFGESSTLSWISTHADSCVIEPDVGPVGPSGSATVSPTRTTAYTITATGPGGTATDQARATVTADVEPQPEGSFGEQYKDLIPPDATAGSYDPKRFSLITGLVRDADGVPIDYVSITILDHQEYGTALTDTEGCFSIPVKGGGTLTVVYQKPGYLTAHRKVYLPWNDITISERVVMIPKDSLSTTTTFDGNPNTVIAHRSSEVIDEFGTRSATLVFTGDNQAYEVDAQGNIIRELATLTTRATEYPTPESMPAKLPPNSAYTYCVELGVDGAERVRFQKPVTLWVENFLGFPVGEAVPVGYYDRDRGVWVPSDNGLVVKLIDIDGDGSVDRLDATGDDLPDDLDGDGSFADEVLGLGDPSQYAPDTTFWRVLMNHFTPWDCNWPYGPPPDATGPNPIGVPQVDRQLVAGRDCQRSVASSVEERSRIFHEDIPIPGTEVTLHYTSSRVEGYHHVITVPASGDEVPQSLKRILVEAEVLGRVFGSVLDPLPRQRAEFLWDGLDHLGRPVQGAVSVRIHIGFIYHAYYLRPAEFGQAFAQAGGDVTGIPARQEVIAWQRDEMVIRRGPQTGGMPKGWTLSVHHGISPRDTSTLYKGDGSITKNNINIITTVAGFACCSGGDGGPATEARLYYPTNMVVDPSGNLYIADKVNHRIRKVTPEGIITTVVGSGPTGMYGGGYSGDGGPATEARLRDAYDVVIDGGGNLYVADRTNGRIRKVDREGIIRTIAFANYPSGLSVDASGNLYFAETSRHRVQKIDPSGTITTVAGNGLSGSAGDGGPAREASLCFPEGITVDREGNLYIADSYNHKIRKVDPSGIITTVCGTGLSGYSGDGGPAREARLSRPMDVAADSSGSLYIADSENHRVRKVDPMGVITTVAGVGGSGYWGPGYGGDGGPATLAKLDYPSGVALDPSGNLYIADEHNFRIRMVKFPSSLGGILATGDVAFSEEGGVGHILSGSGRHKETRDLDTGVALYEFGYDEENRLASVTDPFGNQTVIERDGDGTPRAIVSPDGIVTALTIDPNNHLTRITYPDGSTYSFEYTSAGLMTAKIEPQGNRFEHVFDATGRLTDALDEEGGYWQYGRAVDEEGDVLTQVVTAEGDMTSYLDHTDSTGAYTSFITDPTGAETGYRSSADGLTVTKSLPCGMDLEFQYDVDSEYSFSYVREMREALPSGLQRVTTKNKTYEDTDGDTIPDRITQEVTVNRRVTSLVTDSLVAQKTLVSPEGRTVTILYDPETLLTTNLLVPGLHGTGYGYDERGRITAILGGTRQTTFSYDETGNLASITDPEGYTTSYTYDPVGRMTGIARPDGSFVGFAHDRNGNMIALVNPRDVVHGFGYNGVNLNTAYQTPISGTYRYAYDRDRRLVQTVFPSGKHIDSVYSQGRLVQIQTPEGNVDFTYLCGSKMETITKGGESIAYGYDGSLVISETLGGTLNQSLGYVYDQDFNVSSFTHAGQSVGYGYDLDGLLVASGRFAVSRDSANGLPLAVSDGEVTVARWFNGYGEVETEGYSASGNSLFSFSLVRDNSGRIIEKTETIGGIMIAYNYAYDPMGRLIQVRRNGEVVEAYEYDTVGTRISEVNLLRGISGRSMTYSDEDHLLTAGDTTYTYDFDGFLTNKTNSTNGPNSTSYQYSSRGELLQVILPDGKVIDYLHDPLGRRIAKVVDGIITEKYLWQGMTRLLAVYDGSDNLLMRFEYADGRIPVTMTRGGTTYYLTYDQVGSLRAVVDASGNVIKQVDYDAFGNILSDSNPGFQVPFGFAGGLHDRDTGLVRFGFRDYDPDVGRWTAKDPILFAGGDTDLYGYCLNDPVNWVDPKGTILQYISGFMAGYAVGSFASQLYIWLPVYNEFEREITYTRERLKTTKSLKEYDTLSQHLKWLVTEQANVLTRLGFDFLITGYNFITPRSAWASTEIFSKKTDSSACGGDSGTL